MSTTLEMAEKLDCGHMSTPDGFAAGYATDPVTDKRMCYECAATVDRQHVARMTRTSDVLFAYIVNRQPQLHRDGVQLVNITTWPGVVLGSGTMNGKAHRDGFGNPRQYVLVKVTDDSGFKLEMWGWHYPESGNYIRLRPFIASLRARAAQKGANQ